MKSNKGFTLIETLGVVVILAIIMTIVVPSGLKLIGVVNTEVDQISEDNVKDAVKMYLTQIDEGENQMANNTGSSISINGNTYADGDIMKSYDVRCYFSEHDLNLTINDVKEYYNDNKITDNCKIKVRINTYEQNGYKLVDSYDIELDDNCKKK